MTGVVATCQFPDCTQPADARATWITFPGRIGTFVTIQPLGSGKGQPTCLDHAHHLVDLMLLRSRPEPATMTEDGAP
jgi:hypothetical protein